MTTEEMNGLASIARKKAAIMNELHRFGKDSYNQNQKYKFASAASIFDIIRKLMAEHGLVLFTSAIDGQQNEMESKSGNAGLHTTVKYRMLWIDTETGAMVEDLWLSESDDWQDKGYSKSATLALKSYLLTSFIVSSGEDADDPDYDIGAQPAAKRNATSPKSRNTARQGATTSNGAQNGSQSEIWPTEETVGILLERIRKVGGLAPNANLTDIARWASVEDALDVKAWAKYPSAGVAGHAIKAAYEAEVLAKLAAASPEQIEDVPL